VAAVGTSAPPDPQLDPPELEALLNLMLLPETGDITIRPLLATHGSPSRALAQRASELGERAHSALRSRRQRGRVARALRDIEQLEIKVLVQAHPAYPERLLHLHDPPTALFLIGDVELLRKDCLSIVGARNCTPYGERVTADIAADIVRAGLVVCSGMALGIDSAAHTAALDAAGGTIAVLGCGADVVYPPRNLALYRRIANHGLLVSEFLPGEPPIGDHFPRRNRIIAALSRGVLIVEASLKSGSLITAKHALDIGIDVFAVPGSIGFQQSEGTNKLIQDGAALIAGSSDVLRELGIPVPADRVERHVRVLEPPLDIRADLRTVWNALADEPRHVDEVARACGLPSSVALTTLLELELAGYAQQCAGMQYIRKG
jgi:DNA processing protein